MNLSLRLAYDLPSLRRLSVGYLSTYAIAALAILTALLGLLAPDTIYSPGTHGTLVPNDIVVLAFGPPLVIAGAMLSRARFAIGFIMWPSSLLFIFYNYFIYAVGVASEKLFIVHLLVAVLSIYTAVGVTAKLDFRLIAEKLIPRAPIRTASITLMILATALIARTIAVAMSSQHGSTPVDSITRATWVADFLECPALFLSGVLLLRRQPFGFLASVGMLLQFGVLSIGLVPLMILVSIGNHSPIDVAGVMIVTGFAVIPLALFFLFFRRTNPTNPPSS